MRRTVFAAKTEDDEFVVIRSRRTDALEAINVVDTRGVVETRRTDTFVYICQR